jgi:hypothetical protein
MSTTPLPLVLSRVADGGAAPPFLQGIGCLPAGVPTLARLAPGTTGYTTVGLTIPQLLAFLQSTVTVSLDIEASVDFDQENDDGTYLRKNGSASTAMTWVIPISPTGLPNTLALSYAGGSTAGAFSYGSGRVTGGTTMTITQVENNVAGEDDPVTTTTTGPLGGEGPALGFNIYYARGASDNLVYLNVQGTVGLSSPVPGAGRLTLYTGDWTGATSATNEVFAFGVVSMAGVEVNYCTQSLNAPLPPVESATVSGANVLTLSGLSVTAAG